MLEFRLYFHFSFSRREIKWILESFGIDIKPENEIFEE